MSQDIVERADALARNGEYHALRALITTLTAERDALAEDINSHNLSFDLRWRSDMRAIERWQAATGRTMTLPDHTDLSMWLFAQLETSQALVQSMREALEPFANVVFNDNGDVTYTTSAIQTDDYWRAYQVIAALSRSEV